MRRRRSDDFTDPDEERTRKQLDRYHVKSALMEMWETLDPEYYQRLKREVHKLRHTLTVKGVL